MKQKKNKMEAYEQEMKRKIYILVAQNQIE